MAIALTHHSYIAAPVPSRRLEVSDALLRKMRVKPGITWRPCEPSHDTGQRR
jgi:hypothetical protein